MTLDREAVLKLIERLKKATGPDRELDAQIAKLAGIDVGPFIWDHKGNFVGVCNNVVVPEYTKSIDAAMTLVPERCDGFVDFGGLRNVAKIWVGVQLIHGAHGHSAIALVIAALRALIHQDTKP